MKDIGFDDVFAFILAELLVGELTRADYIKKFYYRAEPPMGEESVEPSRLEPIRRNNDTSRKYVRCTDNTRSYNVSYSNISVWSFLNVDQFPS